MKRTTYETYTSKVRAAILDACPALDGALSITIRLSDGQGPDALFALGLHGQLSRLLETQVAFLRCHQQPIDLDQELIDEILKFAWPHALRAEAWLEHYRQVSS